MKGEWKLTKHLIQFPVNLLLNFWVMSKQVQDPVHSSCCCVMALQVQIYKDIYFNAIPTHQWAL